MRGGEDIAADALLASVIVPNRDGLESHRHRVVSRVGRTQDLLRPVHSRALSIRWLNAERVARVMLCIPLHRRVQLMPDGERQPAKGR